MPPMNPTIQFIIGIIISSAAAAAPTIAVDQIDEATTLPSLAMNSRRFIFRFIRSPCNVIA